MVTRVQFDWSRDNRRHGEMTRSSMRAIAVTRKDAPSDRNTGNRTRPATGWAMTGAAANAARQKAAACRTSEGMCSGDKLNTVENLLMNGRKLVDDATGKKIFAVFSV
jgi:hypothetical protein